MSLNFPALRRTFFAFFALQVLAGSAMAQQPIVTPAPTAAPAPQFSPIERARVLGYWQAPERYQIGPRDRWQTQGMWTVRLTPAASQWLLRYNRAVNGAALPPTQDLRVSPDDLKANWENWVAAKVAYDRFVAAQNAAQLNAPLLPNAPAETTVAPPFPGLIPPTLEAALGNPPLFAAAVSPKKFTVRFEDGYIATYHDHLALSRPRYAYYRFDDGVNFAGRGLGSFEPRELAALLARAGLTPFEQHVMASVSRLEGGFDSINTYDTGFVSVGFIQFASLTEGGGSLGGLLIEYKRRDPQNFEADFRRFGLDISNDGLLVAIDPTSGAEVRGADANALIIADKRLIAVFQRAGAQSDAFRSAQIQNAKTRFYPANFALQFSLNNRQMRGIVSDVIRSEAGMATLFDRSVNTGNIRLLNSVLPQIMTENNLSELSQLWPFEREIIRRMKWRLDALKDPTLGQPK